MAKNLFAKRLSLPTPSLVFNFYRWKGSGHWTRCIPSVWVSQWAMIWSAVYTCIAAETIHSVLRSVFFCVHRHPRISYIPYAPFILLIYFYLGSCLLKSWVIFVTSISPSSAWKPMAFFFTLLELYYSPVYNLPLLQLSSTAWKFDLAGSSADCCGLKCVDTVGPLLQLLIILIFLLVLLPRLFSLAQTPSWLLLRIQATSIYFSASRERERVRGRKLTGPLSWLPIPPTSSVLPTVFTVSPCALAIWETTMLLPVCLFLLHSLWCCCRSSPPAYHQQQWLRKEIKLKIFTWRLYDYRCLERKENLREWKRQSKHYSPLCRITYLRWFRLFYSPFFLPFQVYWWYVSKDLCWPDLCGIESFIFGGLTIM